MPLNLPFTAGRADDPKLYEWMRAVGQQALKSQDMAATYPVTVSRGTPGTPVTYGLSSPLKWPIADKGGQVFNVLSYGATLDGKTDDTLALNAAISAASASGAGGQVLIPLCSGGLRFTSGITLPKGVSLVGTSAPNGTLSSKLIADLTGTAITLSATGASNYYSFIQDIDLRKGTSVPATLISLNNIWFFYINRMYTQGGTTEVVKATGNCAHLAFMGIMTGSNHGPGLRLGSGSGDSMNSVYSGQNEWGGSSGDAVVVNAALVCYTSNTDVFEGNAGNGISVAGFNGGTSEVIVDIQNPYFELNAGYDVDVNSGAAVLGTNRLVVTVHGGHFNGVAGSAGAFRVNPNTSIFVAKDFRSTGHTTGVTLGDLSTHVGAGYIDGKIDDGTKISSTNPATTGQKLVWDVNGSPVFQVVTGATSAAEGYHIYGKAALGPRLTLENLDATSNNSGFVYKARGTELWRTNVDTSGTGAQNWILTDSVNAKQPIYALGNTKGGFVGLGGVNQPNCAVDSNGAIAARRGSVTLATGANNDIAIPDNTYVRITGPGAAFSVSGFTGGCDGRILHLFNPIGVQMTIVNQATSAAANQIFTCTGANVVLRAGTSFATFIYDTANSFWVLMSTN